MTEVDYFALALASEAEAVRRAPTLADVHKLPEGEQWVVYQLRLDAAWWLNIAILAEKGRSLMSQFRPDGSYFRHFDRVPLKRLAPITEEVAWDLLNNNAYGRRPQYASLDAPVLVNKEYALALVQGDRAFIVNNQDGQYELWCGPKDEILKVLEREEIVAAVSG